MIIIAQFFYYPRIKIWFPLFQIFNSWLQYFFRRKVLCVSQWRPSHSERFSEGCRWRKKKLPMHRKKHPHRKTNVKLHGWKVRRIAILHIISSWNSSNGFRLKAYSVIFCKFTFASVACDVICKPNLKIFGPLDTRLSTSFPNLRIDLTPNESRGLTLHFFHSTDRKSQEGLDLDMHQV